MSFRNLLLDPVHNATPDPENVRASAVLCVRCPCGTLGELKTFDQVIADHAPHPPVEALKMLPLSAEHIQIPSSIQTKVWKCGSCGIESRFLECQPVYYAMCDLTMEEALEIVRNAPPPQPGTPPGFETEKWGEGPE